MKICAQGGLLLSPPVVVSTVVWELLAREVVRDGIPWLAGTGRIVQVRIIPPEDWRGWSCTTRTWHPICVICLVIWCRGKLCCYLARELSACRGSCWRIWEFRSRWSGSPSFRTWLCIWEIVERSRDGSLDRQIPALVNMEPRTHVYRKWFLQMCDSRRGIRSWLMPLFRSGSSLLSRCYELCRCSYLSLLWICRLFDWIRLRSPRIPSAGSSLLPSRHGFWKFPMKPFWLEGGIDMAVMVILMSDTVVGTFGINAST